MQFGEFIEQICNNTVQKTTDYHYSYTIYMQTDRGNAVVKVNGQTKEYQYKSYGITHKHKSLVEIQDKVTFQLHIFAKDNSSSFGEEVYFDGFRIDDESNVYQDGKQLEHFSKIFKTVTRLKNFEIWNGRNS